MLQSGTHSRTACVDACTPCGTSLQAKEGGPILQALKHPMNFEVEENVTRALISVEAAHLSKQHNLQNSLLVQLQF